VPGVFNGALNVDVATNRLLKPGGVCPTDGLCYDAAGNQVFDNYTVGGVGGGGRTYDAENRMLTAVSGAGTSSYVYDADGRRTRRQVAGGSTTWQIYGIGGELLAEYASGTGPSGPQKEYGYRNGQVLVVAESNGTVRWMVKDALGTPRMMPDQTGSLAGVKRRDFLPFGEELLAGVGSRTTAQGYGTSSDSVRQKFTGQERDLETGLDYFIARYYSGTQGRFTSPDEFTGGPDELFDFADIAAANPTFYADIGNPQSLNKYQYTYGNPLVYVDSDGHTPTCCLTLPGPVPIPVPIPLPAPLPSAEAQKMVDAVKAADAAFFEATKGFRDFTGITKLRQWLGIEPVPQPQPQAQPQTAPPPSITQLAPVTSPIQNAKSRENYDKHIEKISTAKDQLKELKEKLDNTKGPKARKPVEDAIRKLEKDIKGHEKEVSQKWPNGQPAQ
jgi:RHS repeat-associated protein